MRYEARCAPIRFFPYQNWPYVALPPWTYVVPVQSQQVDVMRTYLRNRQRSQCADVTGVPETVVVTAL
jgi:hypothetical protein